MRIAVHDYAGHPFQFELSRALARRGHVVRHFFFADDPGPKGNSSSSESDPAGYSVRPISIPIAYRKDRLLRRFVADQFYARAAARGITRFRPDLVISGNTPLDVQQALARATEKSGGRFVFWVQDFYGLAMERLLSARWRGLGVLIAARYRRMEKAMLCRSDGIVLISPAFAPYLPAAAAGSERVHVIRNWGPLDLISPRPRANAWRDRLGLGERLVIMYTGTLGLKHDPRLLLALSDAFASDENIAIVVVAEGVNADVLRSMLEAQPRRNLILQPLQPAAEFPDVLGTADVLVALLEPDAAEFSVPSKLLSYLCAGRPVLLSAPVANLSVAVLNESGGGVSVPPGDIAHFVAGARALVQDPALREALGAAGRAYAERHFRIDDIADRFERVFAEAVRPTAAHAIGAPSPA